MDFDFSRLPGPLLAWYDRVRRPLPWRQDREPYHVWLSEIMLQQTRIEAVRGYYARFLAALPDIGALAACPEDELNKLWEGLGYYSRARNLQKAAREIMEKHGGVFPRDYGAIRALPGIGDYTAGAVASICFEEPAPAVDGNVLRVLSRLAALREDVTRPPVKRTLTAALAAAYPDTRRGDFTQAIMELGETVCLPNAAPLCESCPLRDLCRSEQSELWREIPVLPEKKPRRPETHTVFLLVCGDRLAIRKRPPGGLLGGLWELPNCPGALSEAEALARAADWGCAPEGEPVRRDRRHAFTHVEWTLPGYRIACGAMPEVFTWVTAAQLRQTYALPTAFRQFLPD